MQKTKKAIRIVASIVCCILFGIIVVSTIDSAIDNWQEYITDYDLLGTSVDWSNVGSLFLIYFIDYLIIASYAFFMTFFIVITLKAKSIVYACIILIWVAVSIQTLIKSFSIPDPLPVGVSILLVIPIYIQIACVLMIIVKLYFYQKNKRLAKTSVKT